MKKKKRVAIAYDWLDKWGGVERVLLVLHEIFPEAVFYTSVYNHRKASWAKDLKVTSSFMQKLPKFIRNNRILSVPLYPLAFESFDFRGYDLVISVTSSFAKSVITQPSTRHICYLLTPTRFLWSHRESYIKEADGWSGLLFDWLAQWDKSAANKPDNIISISSSIRDRCLKYYDRDSAVIYPPFDIEKWEKVRSKIESLRGNIKPGYFLIVSRLEPYKKVDLAIRAFKSLKDRLVIVGEGSQEDSLKSAAGNNITFTGKVSDYELGLLYKNAHALIMPQEEDFGYVSLEAQFFSTPVIAFKKGGARETVMDGKTGIFFETQRSGVLRQAIERFKRIRYNLKTNTNKYGYNNIKKFDKKIFIEELKRNI